MKAQTKIKNYAVILASGKGSRFNSSQMKQFIKIKNKTLLEYSIEAFEKVDLIDEIILVITPNFEKEAEKIILKNGYKKIKKILAGGKIRKESSYIGISAIEEDEANVLIHDCARPFVSKKIIEDSVMALETHKAAGVGIYSTDTIVSMKDGFISEVLERKSLRKIQTPQSFKLSVIKKAHELSLGNENFTDDCGLVLEHKLAKIYMVEGDENNFKITYPNDIFLAEKIADNI